MFKKPVVKKVAADISTLSIYLRSVKKFGKSTLFRDTVLAKYGDPEKGLLVEVGHEVGDTLLDNVFSMHVDTYAEMLELKEMLINKRIYARDEKGKVIRGEYEDFPHDIKMVAFDVADELVPIFEQEVIRLNNAKNPTKKVESVKAAFGGYNAGVDMAAGMIKDYMGELKKAGLGVWSIAHTRMKAVRQKGSIEEESYMQLTSNLQAAYEAAFGDIMDVVLTGYIDRELETVGSGDNAKNYSTGEVRKLYFRGTSLIDAGSRFAKDAVPEYLVFDEMNMGAKFVKTIEDGIEKSKTLGVDVKVKPVVKPVVKQAPVVEEVVEEEEEIVQDEEITELPFTTPDEPVDEVEEEPDDLFAEEEETESDYPEDLAAVIPSMFKGCKDKEVQAQVKALIKQYGKMSDMDQEGLQQAYDLLK